MPDNIFDLNFDNPVEIKIEVLVEPNIIDEQMVSGNPEDKYDDQTLDDWYDFSVDAVDYTDDDNLCKYGEKRD